MEEEFYRLKRLPPYVFATVVDLMIKARRAGEDIIDLGMGNPDLPTPSVIVDKLISAAKDPRNHRYSASRGITGLRKAICDMYRRRFNVELDPETEAIVTIGAKEGLSHLILATVGPGDLVFVPSPAYPIHAYGVIIAMGDLMNIPMADSGEELLERIRKAVRSTWPRPKMLILNYPHNPTTKTETLDFFVKVVELAKEHNLLVIHDLAYADLCFDGYTAPSFLQAPGAKDVGVEFYSMSKGYSMPGWRVGFCLGNRRMVRALARIKSYLDYGVFQPIQIAAAVGLNTDDDIVDVARETYQSRRDALCDGLKRAGWNVPKPKATMFVWAKIPEPFDKLGSVEFAKLLLREAKVAVSPGVGFGYEGEGYVRFALVENNHRIKQAVRGIRKVLQKGLPEGYDIK